VLVLDVRPIDVFAAGHVPGAISVALDGGSFATRAAFVLDPAERIVVHAGSKGEADEAARLLTAVGLHETVGWFHGDGEEVLQTVTLPAFSQLERGEQVLDVREGNESPGSGWINVPYRLLRVAPPAELDAARPVYTICASGPRATLAASLLVREGFDARPVVGGGVADLAEAPQRNRSTG
jgi:hydroxyacylglutathione hydrolase